VIGEIAMSLMLLVGAGLLLKSFWRLIHVNPGFQTDHLLSARLSLPLSSYGHYGDPQARARFWEQFEEGVRNLPGVEAVGATSELPLSGQHSDDPFHIPGRTYGASQFDDAQFRQVTRGFLSAMRIPLISGRWLNDRDRADSAGVVVVNQAFVKRFFPDGDAIGKRRELMGDEQTTREIVGVIGNIRHFALSQPDWPEMYVPYAQMAPPTMNVVVRANADPMNLAAAVQARVRAVDRDVTISAVTSMDNLLSASLSESRFSSQLIGIFATLALLLAAVGLYGLMAYSVTQRSSEIGVRMALGATRENILKLIVRRGSILALSGIAIGLAVSIAATRLLSSMLFAVSAQDPETFLAVALLLVAVAVVACYVPARRAAGADPMVVLRYE
jgi:putative ABC transport system permease protein